MDANSGFSAPPPHWLDAVIDGVWRENNVGAIARAITHSDRFQEAIRKGLEDAANRPTDPKWMGPSKPQMVRQAILEAMGAS